MFIDRKTCTLGSKVHMNLGDTLEPRLSDFQLFDFVIIWAKNFVRFFFFIQVYQLIFY